MRFASKLLLSAALLGVVALSSAPAGAQQYPSNQDIHFICVFPPGSGADVLVRYFADKMKTVMPGKNIIVDNKSGAGGNIGMKYASEQKPDGYSILVHAGSAVAAAMSLYKQPPFPDAGKALQIAATINRQPFMLVVDAKSPYKTVAELTKAMKEKGAKASYASAAPTGQVMGELYKVATGVTAVEVPYKNAIDSLNDQLSGSLDYGMHDPVYSLAQAREGRLRILGVSTSQRLEASPDLKTMKEQGIDMDLTGWWAAMVPQGTPEPIIKEINGWFVKMVSDPDTKKFLAGFGGDQLIEAPDVAQKRLLNDVKNWEGYVKTAKIEPQG